MYAERSPQAHCFPHGPEDLLVLTDAAEKNPADAKAPYYLGCLCYDKQQYADTVACWERSRALAPGFPTVHRNLSLAYYNKLGRPADAMAELERAYALDEGDARILVELD